ncbi:MAG: VWA domain-containing protein [Phycisphaeraceae bacterium]|nr:VWA domain-containing protein [Phycisphaeraceae bacterium]
MSFGAIEGRIAASLVIGPVQFEQPLWLWALVPLTAAALWIGRSSLSGLSGWSRWAAPAVRVGVLVLLVCALAEPSTRRTARDVAVLAVLDVSRSMPSVLLEAAEATLGEIVQRRERASDKLGVVTAAEEAFVQSLPSERTRRIERRYTGDDNGTDLASAVRLALGVRAKDAATRLVLVSDANETSGSLLEAAQAAKATGVPIDVVPVRYRYPAEVILERVLTPSTARADQTIGVKIVLTATQATQGFLFLSMNGQTIDLDPDAPGDGAAVELREGQNIHTVQVAAGEPGTKRFEAYFEPLIRGGRPVGDEVLENNRGTAVTFVTGEGRVLVLSDAPQEHGALTRALREKGVQYTVLPGRQAPESLEELASFDAVVMVNQPADNFSQAQQEHLLRYIRDLGGGLVMIGGPSSFGAGSWIGSPLADALPVKLDPPQRRELPMGALAIVIDCSGSMAEPVGRGLDKQRVSNEAAVLSLGTLQRRDMVTVIAFSGRHEVVVPLRRNDDPEAIARRIRSIVPTGGTYMYGALREAREQLLRSEAGVRHVIVLTDGETSGELQEAIDIINSYTENRITMSTVAVGDDTNLELLQNLAAATNGRSYSVTSANAQSELPQIFIRESRVVKRSLISEGPPKSPRVFGGGSHAMRGISATPSVRGHVVTADREGLSLVTMRVGDPQKENDPLLAEWQYGLGRVVAFTSDAGGRWAEGWPTWSGYAQFWDQHIRWAMRPTSTSTVRMTTEDRGRQTLVVVEAVDTAGERLGSGSFQARVAGPKGATATLSLRQIGPGRWEGVFPSVESGTYIVGVVGAAPGGEGSEPIRMSAQAAVIKPFAEEFRSLEDNAALLRQVALLTGGRVLFEVVLERGQARIMGDVRRVEAYTRDGLTMPVSTRSIRVLLALAGFGLFILDVGVRRVRVDGRALVAAVKRGLSRARARAPTEQLQTLASARAKARARMEAQAERTVAQRKFDATPEQLARAAAAPEVRSPTTAATVMTKKKTEAQPEAEGMSRLMAAKKRAREEMED